MKTRMLAAVTCGLALFAQPLAAQMPTHYRDFELGAGLASVSMRSGAPVADATVVHRQPALLQELLWRAPYASADLTGVSADPVQQITFSFYNDQLFRIVVDYDHERTQGMTDADMIAGISAAYGSASPASRKVALAAGRVEFGTRVAAWGDASNSAVLYRVSEIGGFRLIVTALRLDALARTADEQAVRLEERDAPRRELARQKQEVDDARAAQEKARLANKAAFRP